MASVCTVGFAFLVVQMSEGLTVLFTNDYVASDKPHTVSKTPTSFRTVAVLDPKLLGGDISTKNLPPKLCRDLFRGKVESALMRGI